MSAPDSSLLIRSSIVKTQRKTPGSGKHVRQPPSRSVALVAGLLCTACAAVVPTHSLPVPNTPTGWIAGNSAGLVTQAEHVDLATWWRRLDDPLLTSLIEDALRASPDLRAAQSKLREARARRQLAGAERLPSISGSASVSRSRSSEASGGSVRGLYSAGFDAAWEPDIFGGIAHGIEAAQADQEKSQANLDNTRVTLAAEIAMNYVDLRAYQGRLAIARGNLASQAETLQLTEWRAQAGLTTSLDVEQARASLEQTRAQLPAYETGLAEARYRLAILLGKHPGALDAQLDMPGQIIAVPDKVAVAIPADTLRQRPDVRAAERAWAAETARLGVAEANRYPGFALSGSLGLDALSLSGLGNGDALAGSLLAKVAGSLFDGGRLKQRVEIQSAIQEQALIAYETSVLNALEEVENALVALANGHRRQDTLSVAARAAGEAARLAAQQYQAGLVDFQTVLSTQRSLLGVQDSLKTSEADTATALIRLYKALGGGWSNNAQP
jgi:NodT family efflux transporter outer membrane factor (OMF) lipoprotein